MFSILRNIINSVSLVAVDLCKVPEKVRRGECHGVLLRQKNISLLKVGLLVVLHLKLLSRRVLSNRVQLELVAIVAVPRFSRVNINNNLFVYLYRLLTFLV